MQQTYIYILPLSKQATFDEVQIQYEIEYKANKHRYTDEYIKDNISYKTLNIQDQLPQLILSFLNNLNIKSEVYESTYESQFYSRSEYKSNLLKSFFFSIETKYYSFDEFNQIKDNFCKIQNLSGSEKQLSRSENLCFIQKTYKIEFNLMKEYIINKVNQFFIDYYKQIVQRSQQCQQNQNEIIL